MFYSYAHAEKGSLNLPSKMLSLIALMDLELFNKRSRPRLSDQLEREKFDLLVIGGGITGACIFRDAALRGMRVALLEARDFASGTSSRSSKLMHGGLRYLQTLGLRLAWESCRERNLHIRLNKRLVRPMAFLVPAYRGRSPSRPTMRLGMLSYELLSGLKNHRVHRHVSREEMLSMAPGLPSDGLLGGWRYYDAAVSDNRWTLETMKDGVRHGGIALNHAPVTELIHERGRIVGAVFREEIQKIQHHVRARAVINATGIFADQIRQMDDSKAAPCMRLSKGTHLVFKRRDVPLGVTTVFSSPIDNRPLFLAKHEGCFVYGTTDDWEESDPTSPIPGKKDVGYLLESLRLFMPEARLGRDKVQFVYSGFRPLITFGKEGKQSSETTREDWIDVSKSGLISVIGGKLTTARIMAVRVLERVLAQMGRSPRHLPCRTHLLSLGGTNEAVAEALARWVKVCPRFTGHFRTLFNRYGLSAESICAEAMKSSAAGSPDFETEAVRAEVQYVCRNEMACRLEDLVERRAGFLHWDPGDRLEKLRSGASLIRAELDLSEEGFEAQFIDYAEYLKRFHGLPADT